MKYVKEFINYSSYIKFKNSNNYIEPNVSLCTSENKTYYNKYHIHDYSQDYLTFVATESGTFKFSKSINYSLDNGTTWTELTSNTDSPTVSAGDKIIWKLTVTSTISKSIGIFSSSGNFIVEGNVMSLLYGDNFVGQTSLNGKDSAFSSLFSGCIGLTSAKNIVLPATVLAQGCYAAMFVNCTNLTTAPSVLPATTLISSCYNSMFLNCTNLTTAPELPATTLADYCYLSMFQGCTNLTTAPELPATTLVNSCYRGMFSACTSLNSITCLATNISANYCTTDWVNGVADNGTFTKAASMTSWTTGANGIPSDWTLQDVT